MEKFPDGLQYEIHLHMHLTVLSDSFLFNCFDDSCLRALAKQMHRHHHLPGHQILHEGDDIDSVHLVRRGKIDIMVHNKQCGTISESYLLKLAIACTVVHGSCGNSTLRVSCATLVSFSKCVVCKSMEQCGREGELEKKERHRALSRFRMKRTGIRLHLEGFS